MDLYIILNKCYFCRVSIPDSNNGGDRGTSPTTDLNIILKNCYFCRVSIPDSNSGGDRGTSTTTDLYIILKKCYFCRVSIPDSNSGGDRRTSPTTDLYCGGALLPAYVCSYSSNRNHSSIFILNDKQRILTLVENIFYLFYFPG